MSSAIASIDFGEGGAFAEVHVPQYPRGMGKQIPSQPSAATASMAHTQTAYGTLVVKHVASSELQRPPAKKIEENVARTKDALQKKLDEVTGHVGNLSQRSDPLDPRMRSAVVAGDTAADSTTARQLAVFDPAPVIRSPTKKPQSRQHEAEQEALTSVPFCVSSWTNKKNLVIALEDRVAASHGSRDEEVPQLARHHVDLALALNRAKKEVALQQDLAAKTEQEAQERRQAEVEGSALRDAQALLETMGRDRATQAAAETREERHNRVRLEREHREREREVKARLRRHQDAAARLGITLEALEADGDLLRSVDDAAHHHDGLDTLAQYVDARVLQDASNPEHHADEDASAAPGGAPPASTIRQRELVVSTRGIENQMKALAEEQQQNTAATTGHATQRPVDCSDDEDDTEEDMFAVHQVLSRKKHRTE